MVRHIVSKDNVSPDGVILHPERIRHGVIRAGRIAALSGVVDPKTHLNLDFPHHRVDLCAIAEEMSVGASVLWDEGSLRFARVADDAYKHLGPVQLGSRRTMWLDTLRARRERNKGKGTAERLLHNDASTSLSTAQER